MRQSRFADWALPRRLSDRGACSGRRGGLDAPSIVLTMLFGELSQVVSDGIVTLQAFFTYVKGWVTIGLFQCALRQNYYAIRFSYGRCRGLNSEPGLLCYSQGLYIRTIKLSAKWPPLRRIEGDLSRGSCEPRCAATFGDRHADNLNPYSLRTVPGQDSLTFPLSGRMARSPAAIRSRCWSITLNLSAFRICNGIFRSRPDRYPTGPNQTVSVGTLSN